MRVPVVVALCLAPALAAPQSLGDAARRQARERSTQAPATRVYTEADLRPKGDAPEGVPADPSATETRTEAAAVPVASAPALTSEDAVRAQLDRETEARKQRERFWRQLAGAALARLAAAQREHDAACGPGVLVLTGG
jgi:hypothetical protein